MPADSSFFQSWLRRPQTLWLRRAIFQIHLWSGIALGIYIVVVCASGSLIVFKNDILDVLEARIRVEPDGRTILTRDELARAVEQNLPGSHVRKITKGRDGEEASEVAVARPGLLRGLFGDDITRRLVDPYSGRDMGPAVSQWYRFLSVTTNIHGRLLMGSNGMTANAVGGLLVMGVCFSGMIIWWPGIATWKRALIVRRGSGWKRFNFDVHSAFGFWTFAFLLMWGATAAYFVFPDPARAVVNYFTPILPPPLPRAQLAQPAPSGFGNSIPGAPRPRRRRPLTLGGKILRDFSYAHYGNFWGWPVKAIWVFFGFAPVVLFGSGLIMWWNRVLSPTRRRWMRDKRAMAQPEQRAFSD